MSARKYQSHGFRKYLEEISEVPLLTRKQEIDLAKAIEAGRFASKQLTNHPICLGDDSAVALRETLFQHLSEGEKARQKFIKSNLKLVVSVAKKFLNNPERYGIEDLVGFGNEALVKAVDKFDWRRGWKFSSSAYKAIMRKIHKNAGYGKKKRIQEQGLCEFLEDKNAVSPETQASNFCLSEHVKKILDEADLNPQTRQILILTFGFDNGISKTDSEVADILGVPLKRVSRNRIVGIKILARHKKIIKLNKDMTSRLA